MSDQVVIIQCGQCGRECAVAFPPCGLLDMRAPESEDEQFSGGTQFYFCGEDCRAGKIRELLNGTEMETGQAVFRSLGEGKAQIRELRARGRLGPWGPPDPSDIPSEPS